jgi:hypothetical protein
MTPCNVAVGYQRFEWPCCHLQGEVNSVGERVYINLAWSNGDNSPAANRKREGAVWQPVGSGK